MEEVGEADLDSVEGVVTGEEVRGSAEEGTEAGLVVRGSGAQAGETEAAGSGLAVGVGEAGGWEVKEEGTW